MNPQSLRQTSEASNGVVHVIDAVMVPSDFELQ